MNRDISDAIVSSAKSHAMRDGDKYAAGAWLYAFPSDGCFSLAPEGLGEFWRLYIEAVFDCEFIAHPSHPLKFHDLHGGRELEVTDEWGDAWWIIMGQMPRSESSTPLRRRSSLNAEAYLECSSP